MSAPGKSVSVFGFFSVSNPLGRKSNTGGLLVVYIVAVIFGSHKGFFFAALQKNPYAPKITATEYFPSKVNPQIRHQFARKKPPICPK